MPLRGGGGLEGGGLDLWLRVSLLDARGLRHRSTLYVLVWQGMTGWCSARFAHLFSQSHSVLILIHPHLVAGPIHQEFGIHMMMMIATEATSSSQEFLQNSAKFPFDFPWYPTSIIK